MRKHPYHPRAYMSGMRNVQRGLASRTKIITTLEESGKLRASEIGKKAGLGQACVTYHLKLMARQKVVSSKKAGRSFVWMLTTYGQERLFA
jgi:predicted transcriptional regulator